MKSFAESGEPMLPQAIEKLIGDLAQAAKNCFQEDLISFYLFGSGAEGRLRATSDLNLLMVLKRYEKSRVDSFREPLRMACMACRASVMFVLATELGAAAEAFAVKFDDIGRRRRLLFGEDLLSGLTVSRQAKKNRLRQVLMNLCLRMRERYAAISIREEQLALVIAEMAGPLRSAAATLLELEGETVTTPKSALKRMTDTLSGADWPATLDFISRARESKSLPASVGGSLMFRLIELTEAMYRRAERLE